MAQRYTELTHETHLVRINSIDRNRSTDSTTDFTVSMGPSARQHNVSRIVLSRIVFPNFMYNINTTNYTFRFTNDVDGALSVTLPVGQYKITELISALQTAINLLLTNVLTITQEALTDKLIFTMDIGTMAFSSVETDPLNVMAPYLGLTLDSGASTVTTFDSMTRLNGLTQCFIHSNRLSKQNSSSSDGFGNDTFCSIPIVEPFGNFVYWTNTNHELASVNYISPRKLDSEIDIQLRDQNNQLIEIGGHHVDLTFKIYFTY